MLKKKKAVDESSDHILQGMKTFLHLLHAWNIRLCSNPQQWRPPQWLWSWQELLRLVWSLGPLGTCLGKNSRKRLVTRLSGQRSPGSRRFWRQDFVKEKKSMPGHTGVSLWGVFAGSQATETAGRSLKQKCFFIIVLMIPILALKHSHLDNHELCCVFVFIAHCHKLLSL